MSIIKKLPRGFNYCCEISCAMGREQGTKRKKIISKDGDSTDVAFGSWWCLFFFTSYHWWHHFLSLSFIWLYLVISSAQTMEAQRLLWAWHKKKKIKCNLKFLWFEELWYRCDPTDGTRTWFKYEQIYLWLFWQWFTLRRVNVRFDTYQL